MTARGNDRGPDRDQNQGQGDDWISGAPSDTGGGRSPGEVPLPNGQEAAMRRVAREQVVRGWEEVGVEFREFGKRQEHVRLLEWIRGRKAIHEAGWGKVGTTAIGAAVSAIIAGLIAYVTGKH